MMGPAEAGSGEKTEGQRSQPGGVAEWFKASRLKREDRKVRGFESYPLRHRPKPGSSEIEELKIDRVTERWPSGRRQPPAKRLVG